MKPSSRRRSTSVSLSVALVSLGLVVGNAHALGPDHHIAMGNESLRLYRTLDAIEEYERAIALAPEAEQAHLGILRACGHDPRSNYMQTHSAPPTEADIARASRLCDREVRRALDDGKPWFTRVANPSYAKPFDETLLAKPLFRAAKRLTDPQTITLFVRRALSEKRRDLGYRIEVPLELIDDDDLLAQVLVSELYLPWPVRSDRRNDNQWFEDDQLNAMARITHDHSLRFLEREMRKEGKWSGRGSIRLALWIVQTKQRFATDFTRRNQQSKLAIAVRSRAEVYASMQFVRSPSVSVTVSSPERQPLTMTFAENFPEKVPVGTELVIPRIDERAFWRTIQDWFNRAN